MHYFFQTNLESIFFYRFEIKDNTNNFLYLYTVYGLQSGCHYSFLYNFILNSYNYIFNIRDVCLPDLLTAVNVKIITPSPVKFLSYMDTN